MEKIVDFFVKSFVSPYKSKTEYHWLERFDPEALDILLELSIGSFDLSYREARTLIEGSLTRFDENNTSQ